MLKPLAILLLLYRAPLWRIRVAGPDRFCDRHPRHLVGDAALAGGLCLSHSDPLVALPADGRHGGTDRPADGGLSGRARGHGQSG